MSIPKDFFDLMRTLGRPVGAEVVSDETTNLADNDWTAIDISNLMELKLDAVDGPVLISTDTGVGNHFCLSPTNPPLCLTSLVGPTVTLYAQADTAASGSKLQYFGFRNIAGGLAT